MKIGFFDDYKLGVILDDAIVDVSSAVEYQGKCTSDVNRYTKQIWQDHNWYWGLAFCDPMHFQYATDY